MVQWRNVKRIVMPYSVFFYSAFQTWAGHVILK